MREIKTALLAASILLGPAWEGAHAEEPSARRLTLRTYNYAGILPEVLARAERRADRLFEQVGLETRWLHCPTSPGQIAENPACRAPIGSADFILNLLPLSMSKKYGLKRSVFGFARPTAYGSGGDWVSLFVSRVTDLARHGSISGSHEEVEALILGHMLAHEVGHLLLGPRSHSPRGVMSFPWNKRTLTLMERNLLRFSRDEENRIQLELARRAGLLPMVASKDGAGSL